MLFPLKDDVPSRTPPIVTITLIVLNVLVFLFELSLGPVELNKLVHVFGVVPRRVMSVLSISPTLSILPFFTFQFLHGGFMHILGNMWFLWLFGDNVEDRMGHFRFLLFYLASGFTAGIFQTIHAPMSSIPVIGASGAIAGVMGAYFLLYPFARIKVLFLLIIIPFVFYIPALILLPLWFLTQVSNVFSPLAMSSHVAWWAHVGGFLFGMATVPILDRQHLHRIET